jgi:tetratricopeptide (TPR) repeat protein
MAEKSILLFETAKEIYEKSLKPDDERLGGLYNNMALTLVDLKRFSEAKILNEKAIKVMKNKPLEIAITYLNMANAVEMEQGILAYDITKEYTEIMPGRPTISEHRHPRDSINKFICSQSSDLFTRLTTNIITAAEQQTMNYYMNIGNHHPTEIGRKIYAEIAMIEEQHVSEYGSLLDANCTWLENWVMHEYTECYLYYSCFVDEKDPEIKAVYERLYLEECGHLKKAAEMASIGYEDTKLESECRSLAFDIDEGIKEYGLDKFMEMFDKFNTPATRRFNQGYLR